MEDKDILLIPDIHGRDFWKKSVLEDTYGDVVFLGDYLDPYSRENISREEAWDNFMDIVDFKKAHKENVHLLLGNHDLAYFDHHHSCTRNDEVTRVNIQAFFRKNLSLFDLAYETVAGGRRILVTHAGINRRWLMKYGWLFGGDDVTAEALNYGLHDKAYQKDIILALADISYIRGGMDNDGSMVWADIREFLVRDCLLPDTFQIVGHTQQDEKPYRIGDSLICIDCRRAFHLDVEGNLI